MGTSLRMMRVIDSHTAGQPTRVIVEGGPDLGTGPLTERRDRLRKNFDRFRSAVVGEPRGSDALVGAVLCKPNDPSCTTGVIFFDNVRYLDMCGHAMIGLAVTLEYLGHIKGGPHRVETPVGVVTVELNPIGDISIQNVPSYRYRKDVVVDLDGAGKVTGDIAWGGSWFFLVNDHHEELNPNRVGRLTDVTRTIRRALAREGVTGPNGEEIDNVALFGAPHRNDANSKNFVLRSGKSYGRSPCGTATSAKLASLFTDGAIVEGQIWRQESIVGTIFDGAVKVIEGKIVPTIRSTAYVTAESMLIVDERDPFCWGLS
jgi:4-hydroxyproline epimerase